MQANITEFTNPQVDRWLAFQLSAFNMVGFFVSTVGSTFVDARLEHHVRFGARVYPLGYWIVLLAPVVFLACYYSLSRAKRSRWLPIIPPAVVLAITVAVLPAFLPEFPHMGILVVMFLYALGTAVTLWVRLQPIHVEFINDTSIHPTAKIERLKELAAFWRTLSTGFAIAYVALVAAWMQTVWNAIKTFISGASGAEGEVFLLGQYAIVNVIVFTIFVVCVPLYQALSKAHLLNFA